MTNLAPLEGTIQGVPHIYRNPEKLERVRQFLNLGFSARRIAELLGVKEQEVAWLKRNGSF